jgi:hypothetical protein
LREMELLVSNFQGFNLSFVRREANKSAHLCAKHALSVSVHIASYELIPVFLIESVQSDRLTFGLARGSERHISSSFGHGILLRRL